MPSRSFVGGRVEFQVLGPLRVARDGRPVELDTARKPILLLAAMLIYEGHPVPTDQILDVLWNGDPPASALKNIQLYAHRIRRVLGVARVPHGPPRLMLAPDDRLDMHEFRRHTARASVASA